MNTNYKPVLVLDVDEVLGITWKGIIGAYQKVYGGKPEYYGADGWGVPYPEAIRRLEELIQTHSLHDVDPAPSALDAVRDFRNHFEIAIVTGRNPVFRSETEEWLGRHFGDIFCEVVFTHLFGTDSQRLSKADVCKRLNAVCLIDDHPEHAISTAEANPDMSVLLFGDYPWHARYDLTALPGNVRRVNDWQQATAMLLPNPSLSPDISVGRRRGE